MLPDWLSVCTTHCPSTVKTLVKATVESGSVCLVGGEKKWEEGFARLCAFCRRLCSCGCSCLNFSSVSRFVTALRPCVCLGRLNLCVCLCAGEPLRFKRQNCKQGNISHQHQNKWFPYIMAAFMFCSKPFKAGKRTREFLLELYLSWYVLGFFFILAQLWPVQPEIESLIVTNLINLHIYLAHLSLAPLIRLCQKGNAPQFGLWIQTLFFVFFSP